MAASNITSFELYTLAIKALVGKVFNGEHATMVSGVEDSRHAFEVDKYTFLSSPRKIRSID